MLAHCGQIAKAGLSNSAERGRPAPVPLEWNSYETPKAPSLSCSRPLSGGTLRKRVPEATLAQFEANQRARLGRGCEHRWAPRCQRRSWGSSGRSSRGCSQATPTSPTESSLLGCTSAIRPFGDIATTPRGPSFEAGQAPTPSPGPSSGEGGQRKTAKSYGRPLRRARAPRAYRTLQVNLDPVIARLGRIEGSLNSVKKDGRELNKRFEVFERQRANETAENVKEEPPDPTAAPGRSTLSPGTRLLDTMGEWVERESAAAGISMEEGATLLIRTGTVRLAGLGNAAGHTAGSLEPPGKPGPQVRLNFTCRR